MALCNNKFFIFVFTQSLDNHCVKNVFLRLTQSVDYQLIAIGKALTRNGALEIMEVIGFS